MNLGKTAILLLGLAFSCQSLAEAASNYLGIKGGRMLTAFDDTKGAFPVGFVAGHSFDQHISIEASFIKGSPTYTVGSLKITNNAIDDSEFIRDKLTAKVYGLYLNYRTFGEFYLLGKAGIANASMESNEFVPGIDNTAFSGGIGAGWRLGPNIWLELEATHIDKNLTYLGISGIMAGF